MKKLPDTEFDVMKVVWDNTPPVTTTMIMEQLGTERGWPVPALITMLTRLNEKGFVYSEKKGKMRYYYPLVKKSDYIEFITKEFMSKYHGDSFTSFYSTYYDVRMISDAANSVVITAITDIRRRILRLLKNREQNRSCRRSICLRRLFFLYTQED